MSSIRIRTAAALGALAAAGLVSQAFLAGSAGAVTATKVQLKNGQLSVEGSVAVRGTSFVGVESTVSAASTRAGADGRYKLQPPASALRTAS